MRGFKLRLNKLFSFIAAAVGLSIASPASAAYTISFQEVGGSVVSTGSGSLNTSALTLVSSFATGAQQNGSGAFASVGIGFYSSLTSLVGPSSFGSGLGARPADVDLGALVGVSGAFGSLLTPLNYISGSDLGTSTGTYNNSTIVSLGLTPGSYVYSWGQGETADSLTVQIGDVGAVPEPSTWAMMLLGFAGIGAAMRRRRRGAALHAMGSFQ